MTSCGCFEVICAYLPECNGIMAVNREFQGETPVGMKFSSLAGSVGGGQQTPGFMGCGKVFLTSRKFLQAEGGYRRVSMAVRMAVAMACIPRSPGWLATPACSMARSERAELA